MNLYAEESALDDAIYYLAEALRNDVINIQVFLRVCSKGETNEQDKTKITFHKTKLTVDALGRVILCLSYASLNSVLLAIFQNVRSLARKKFMVRALMNKVREQTNKCEVK